MIRYLISDGTARTREPAWLRNIAGWIERGVDFVQIRESELNTRSLAELTRKVLQMPNPFGTRVLINDRADVAIACRASGVHLRHHSMSPALFGGRGLLISVACHDPAKAGQITGADFILLAPIFNPLSKEPDKPVLGLDALHAACRSTETPVIALGGVTQLNERRCLDAGAAGIAGIDYFADR